MTTQVKIKTRKGEGGNVLFLILIAVALFAALSYAVTQSTRSGGGDASKEKNLVSSATVTQYPASIKTAIIRMMVSNGVTVDQLTFDKPSNFSTLDDSTAAKSKKYAVFYPDPGGGATYAPASADVMSTSAPGEWFFNANNEVQNIGTNRASGTTPTSSSADLIAFLPKLNQAVCDKIHEQLGMAKTYATLVANLTDKNAAAVGILATTGVVITSAVLDGQPQGCFYKDATDKYVYYHVLVER